MGTRVSFIALLLVPLLATMCGGSASAPSDAAVANDAATGGGLIDSSQDAAAASVEGSSSDSNSESALAHDVAAADVGAADVGAADVATDHMATADVAASDGPRGDARSCVPAGVTGTCNTIVPQGARIVSTCSTAAVPMPQGGAIQDGTYVLDAITYFGACPGAADFGRYTWQMCGSSWTTAQEVPRIAGDLDAGFDVLRVSLAALVQNMTITLTVQCSSPGQISAPPPWGYTASAGALVFYIKQAGGAVRADSYRLQ
jgi:hypothetical protein